MVANFVVFIPRDSDHLEALGDALDVLLGPHSKGLNARGAWIVTWWTRRGLHVSAAAAHYGDTPVQRA